MQDNLCNWQHGAPTVCTFWCFLELLSNFSRGRGGAMGRGSFHAKVLVLFIKNGRVLLQLIKKNTVEMQEDFLRKFCSCVYFLQT